MRDIRELEKTAEDSEETMSRNAPPEIEIKWPGGSLRAVGVPALVLVAGLAIAYLAMLWS
jgi:hypothetical protein